MTTRFKFSVFLFSASVFCIFNSCNSLPDPVPFPQGESEFSQPVVEKLSFSESSDIKWITIPRDCIKPPVETPFDLEKLPSKPFPGLSPMPLAQPMKVNKFNWESLDDTVFSLSNLSANKLAGFSILVH